MEVFCWFLKVNSGIDKALRRGAANLLDVGNSNCMWEVDRSDM